jgi:hypothetical protein
MADVVAIRAALQRLRFTAASAAFITDTQGFDDINLFADLDDKEASTLCKIIRNPGGTIPNPNAGDAGAPATIPNRGLPVGMIAEGGSLKAACYFVRHRHRCSRPITAAELQLASVRVMRDMKQVEDGEEDPEEPEPLTKIAKMQEKLDEIELYFATKTGITGVPLSYVVRPEPDPQEWTPATEPGLLLHIQGMEEEEIMIERAPHHTLSYAADNKAVYELLKKVFKDSDGWAIMNDCTTRKNGHLSWMALSAHYLGRVKKHALTDQYEDAIDKAVYTGEKQRFNFEKLLAGNYH